MYFCPKCNYSFDISKNVASDKTDQTTEEDTRKKLDNVESAIKRLKAGKSLNAYKAEFTLEDLESNPHYIKLEDEDKEKLNVLFNTTSSIGGIMFKCNNCNYKKKINETIKLYQLNIDSVYSVYRSMDDNKLLFMNPIYPRTHDYSCKNINCISHKDETNKEAVFFREKDSYLTNYICGVCYSGWKV
jgi:DNA-directed RNA polymerase subunit M/transcription elongation factor TFIIS